MSSEKNVQSSRSRKCFNKPVNRNYTFFQLCGDVVSFLRRPWRGVLSPRPNQNLEDQPLSAVPYCLFNIFAVTLRISANLRMRHAVVTRDPLTMEELHNLHCLVFVFPILQLLSHWRIGFRLFEFLTMVKKSFAIFWVVTLCS